MTSTEIISLVVTFIGIFSFATIFTILYKSFATMSVNELRSGKRDIEIIDEIIYNKQDKIQKRSKMWRQIRDVAFYLTMIIIIPVFIFALFSRITNNTIMLGNKTVMVVASGSMSYIHEDNKYLVENNIDTQFSKFDIIILEKVNSPSELKQYDTIAFVNDEGTNIIHRIKSIKSNGKYETRGDAVGTSDPYSPSFEDVIGRYTGEKINTIGIFVLFFQSYAGIITIVSLVYCLIMIDRISEKINKVQKERIEHLEQALGFSVENNTGMIKAAYLETIYYKGYAYHFKDGMFVEKDEITEGPYLEKSNETMIKEVKDNESDSLVITEENIINEEQGD